MTTERYEFLGHSGNKLSARLDRPNGTVRSTALFAHCFTCSKDIPAAKRIAEALSKLGIAVLRFDFTGLGHSDGEFSNTNFTSNVHDLVLAAEHLKNINLPPSILIGHSLGGAAVLKAASEIPSTKAVVTIGAPADPSHVSHHFEKNLDKIMSEGEAEVNLGGRQFTIKKQFVEDIAQENLKPAISKLKKALLVMHAPLDNIVGIDNAAQIYGAAKHPKSFVTLDDANHLITRQRDASYAASVIAVWVEKYLPQVEPIRNGNVPDGTTRVSEEDSKGFRQFVSFGNEFQFLADEPLNLGGTNLGPNPYQFLSASLGACTSMTMRMYARRKKLPLEHVEVDVSHSKSHAVDCENCEEEGTKIDVFHRVIRFKGALTQEQQSSLLRIADKCPVHKTLEARSEIKTSLAPE